MLSLETVPLGANDLSGEWTGTFEHAEQRREPQDGPFS